MTTAIKTLTLTITALLVVSSAATVPAQRSRKGEPTAQEKLAGRFKKAKDLLDKWAALAQGGDKEATIELARRTIREMSPILPELSAATGDRARFVKFPFNSTRMGFDAVRFRTPSVGKEYQLFWDIVMPGDRESVNLRFLDILPVDGGFLIAANPQVRTDLRVPGVNLPENNFAMSRYLYGEKLRAGKEYILWFDLKTDEPTPGFINLRIEPIQPVEPPKGPALEKARAAFQASLEALNERHDGEVKALRKKYLAELDKSAKTATRKDRTEADRILAEADRANRGDSEAGDPRCFRVLRAEYGEGDRWMDVTMPLRAMVRTNSLKYDPGENAVDGFKPDPHFGTRKHLIIVYSLDGVPAVSMTADNQAVELPPPTAPKATLPAKP
jgi:DnaJ-like protein C11, C-terminal